MTAGIVRIASAVSNCLRLTSLTDRFPVDVLKVYSGPVSTPSILAFSPKRCKRREKATNGSLCIFSGELKVSGAFLRQTSDHLAFVVAGPHTRGTDVLPQCAEGEAAAMHGTDRPAPLSNDAA